MRLFIAVNLDEELKKKILPLQEELKKTGADVKWVAVENLHLTLKFLGEVSEEKATQIEPVIVPILACFPSFEMKLSGFGVFPNFNYPRVIWLGIEEGGEELKGLSEKIEDSLVSLGFDKEERPFTAHLTLGRVRSAKNKNQLISIIEEKKNIEIGKQKVGKIYLMQSILKPTGPIYLSLKEWQLSG
ncbi:MAG TPA: RNA 2',3'-cyclic phosphodiesterase [Elusimicrobia bacterium]|jgi:2'-5' RNA ligase|nr:RNA 2',3'-cyclic phosphodiesterase [Elusimicrobiota bacterium]